MKLLVAIWIGLILIGLTLYMGGRLFHKTLVTALDTKTPACLTLAGSTISEQDGVSRIVGTVRNDCTRKFFIVNVVFALDRKDSTFAGGAKAIGSVRDIAAGTSATFQTLPVGRDTSYRFEEINSF